VTRLHPAWIAAQRWFRAKQRPIASLAEVERAPLDGGADLRIVEVRYADGGAADRYLVPTVDGREPHDGEGAWAAIVAAMAADAELRGRAGRFDCTPTPALDDLLPSATVAAAALDERRLGVEQSNTSVVVGDRLILKLYRLLEAGENPDLEVGAFLAGAGFADTPPVAGAVHYLPDDGDPVAVAMLQGLVPTSGDAWHAMLDALARDPRDGVELAARIGALTAAMHGALASRPDDPAFPARSASTDEAAAWRTSAEAQLAQAVAAVSGETHARLVELAPRARARFADSFGSASGEARVTRIHGDYHLGQLLARPDGGYSVIDFEGEPARPLAERRAPACPLRDVAGLLRSLDYAARTAAARDPAFAPDAWLAEARGAFLAAYGDVGEDGRALLDAFELEKACYEVRYEASNRPAWLWLPVAALERLLAAA
jgi:maltose alpha-D-glucosyltransferase/alpha-amylase